MSKRFGELIDVIEAAENGYKRYEPMFKDMLDAYLMRMDQATYDSLARRNKSRLYFPAINAKVKRIITSLQESYFSNDKFAKLMPDDEADASEVEVLQEATDYYLNRTSMFMAMSDVFFNVTVMGTCFTKTYWNDGVKIESISPLELFVDPSAKTWEDINYFVHNIYMTPDEIKRLQRSGVFKRTFKADELQSDDMHDNVERFNRIKLQEVYMRNKKGMWTVSTVYDSSVALRQDVQLQDGHPFNMGVLIPQISDVNETDAVMVYGEPCIASSKHLQTELNMRRNQQLDAIKALLNPKFIIGANSGVNPLDLERPFGAIRARSTQDIQILPTPTINDSIFDVQQLTQEISETLGVSPQQNGIGPNKKMTATESSIISNEGNIRLQSYIRSLNETMIEPLVKRVASLVWKYGEARFFLGVDRSKEFEFMTTVNTGLGATNKEIQMNGLREAFQMTGQLLQMAASVQDQQTAFESVGAAKKLLKEMLPLQGIADIDNYFTDEGDEVGREQRDPTIQGSFGQPQGVGGMDNPPELPY